MIRSSVEQPVTALCSMLREAGAKEVHMRVSSPPFLWPCYFGTDVPAREQLIAYNRTVEEIRQVIGADSPWISGLAVACVKWQEDLPICTGCFTGNYPLDPPMEDIRGEFEQ